MTRISFIIGYSASMAAMLAEIVQKLSRRFGFEYKIITPYGLGRGDKEFIKGSDFILIYSSRLPDEYEDILEEIKDEKMIAGLEDTHSYLTNIGAKHYTRLVKYLKIGGRENLESLVYYILKLLGYNVDAPQPKPVPWHGVYHPALGVYRTTQEYLQAYKFSDRPLVGILFYRNDWLYGRTRLVDELVKAIEAEGLGVLPVFTYGFKDKYLGTPSSEDTIREYFIQDNKSIIDVLIILTSFFILDHGRSKEWSTKGYELAGGLRLLKKINAPVLEYLTMYDRSPEQWRDDPKGCGYMTLVYRISMSEVDGAIEPIPVAATRLNEYGGKDIVPLRDQIGIVARRIKKWVRLRHKPPSERRIAIILINPPCKGLEANVAVGFGLDVPESVVEFLKKLKEAGYDVGDEIPETGEELIKMIMEKKALSEFRWTSVEDIVTNGGALDILPLNKYLEYYRELPEKARREIESSWGDPVRVVREKPPGLAGMIHDGGFVIPGLRFGNVVIIPQPKRGCAGPRCDGTVCKILHDPNVPPPHQWLAVYWWITRVFDADIMIHFGTHGYLEFLPGKNACLSSSCWPLISIDDTPHLYVYVVSNPMEGSIAKRRGMAALVDHLYPPMAAADTMSELDDLVNQYLKAKNMGDETRRKELLEMIKELAVKHDIKLREDMGADEIIEAVHKKLHMIGETDINLGLHVLGRPPAPVSKLAKYVVTIDTRLPPEQSLVKNISRLIGVKYGELDDNPMKIHEKLGIPYRELKKKIREAAEKILEKTLESKEQADHLRILEEIIMEYFPGARIRSLNDCIYALRNALRIAELLAGTDKEMVSLLDGVAGGYVEPGPSGNLYRGKTSVLPTGRNFYLLDPRTLPTRAAWMVGVKSADLLIKYYVEKHGRMPETVGQVLWSIDAFKADGEQLAQILYLLGVEPVWDDGGNVVDLKPIPLEELGRPRIDVLVRISGIVRDLLPNYIELIDKAVSIVISLDEPPEMNYPRKHYLEDVEKLVSLGYSRGEAEEIARHRVYGSPPGSYGAGVNLAVEASAWKDSGDLAKIWVQWSGYAYTRSKYGVESHEHLVLSLRRVDMVNRNHVSDEHDILGCCCYFSYHGGFYNAAKTLSGREVEAVTVDTRNVYSLRIRGMNEEIERVVRAKLLNDQWIAEMKKHGYRGASEFQRKILHFYGWASVSGLAEDWMFEKIAEKYVLDEEMREWFLEHNKWALEEITRRLIEAGLRGVWKAPSELLDKLRHVYSEIEGYLEEELGAGEVQGGAIDVVGYDEVEEWREKMERIDKILEEI